MIAIAGSSSALGFEHYFRELAPLLAAPERDQAAIGEVVARYQLDIDFATIPTLAERHDLRLGSSPSRPARRGPVVALRDVARYASGPLVRAIGQPRLRWRLDTSSSEQVAGWSGGFGRLPWGPTGSSSGLSSTAA